MAGQLNEVSSRGYAGSECTVILINHGAGQYSCLGGGSIDGVNYLNMRCE